MYMYMYQVQNNNFNRDTPENDDTEHFPLHVVLKRKFTRTVSYWKPRQYLPNVTHESLLRETVPIHTHFLSQGFLRFQWRDKQ